MKKAFYYEHPASDSMSTTIKSLEKRESFLFLELSDTLFYPEGGGQPADRGFIGKERVLDVQKSEGRILHKVQNHPGDGELTLTLDRPFRDHFTKQHTGQHLISALLHEIFGAETVSVHLGEEETTIEVDSQSLTDEDLTRIEDRANQEITKARPVRSFIVKDREDLKKYPIRRNTDLNEHIRLVEIEGLDRTPCGGLHAASTAELGLIKYTGMEKIRGRLRLKWKISIPAYTDYRMRFDLVEKAGKLLSARPEETMDRLEALLAEKLERDKLLKKALEREAGRICRELSGSVCCFPPLVATELKDCPRELFNMIVKNLSASVGLSFLLCCENEGKINWALHLPFHKSATFDAFRTDCLSLIHGKGGGRIPQWQGSGENPEMIQPFLSSFRTLCQSG